MKTLFLILITLIFILMILVYPLRIKWSFHVNLIENVGYVVFKILFLRLMCERFKINGNLEFETERETKKNKKSECFFKLYIQSLARKVDVKRIDLFCDIGGDDAHFISVFSGWVYMLLSALYGVILSRYDRVKIYSDILPDFNKNKLEATGKIIVTFSLVSVIISVCRALIIFRRRDKIG